MSSSATSAKGPGRCTPLPEILSPKGYKAVKKFKDPKLAVCPRCNGTGKVPQQGSFPGRATYMSCGMCYGFGYGDAKVFMEAVLTQ